MDQELEAVTNSGPRLITPETWVFLIDFAHSSPMPVTTDFVEYVFDGCSASSTSPSWRFTTRRLDRPTIIPGHHHHRGEIPLRVSFSAQEWLVEHRLV